MNDQERLKSIIERHQEYIDQMYNNIKSAKERLSFYKMEYKDKYGHLHSIEKEIYPGDYIKLKHDPIIHGNPDRIAKKHDGKWVRVCNLNQVGNYDFWIEGRRRTARRVDISDVRPGEKKSPDECDHPHEACEKLKTWPLSYKCHQCGTVVN